MVRIEPIFVSVAVDRFACWPAAPERTQRIRCRCDSGGLEPSGDSRKRKRTAVFEQRDDER
jgi:hypothetical protein